MHLREEKLAPPWVARNLIALKMFYRFLRLEEASVTTSWRCSIRLPFGSTFRKCSARKAWSSC